MSHSVGDKVMIMIAFVIVQPHVLLYTANVPMQIHQHEWLLHFPHYPTFFLLCTQVQLSLIKVYFSSLLDTSDLGQTKRSSEPFSI